MPGVADVVDAMVTVELPELGVVIVAGLNVAVTPEGRPDTERVIVLLKLPVVVVLTESVPVVPATRDRVDAESVNAKAEVVVDPVDDQLATRALASIEPRPVTLSYPVPAE